MHESKFRYIIGVELLEFVTENSQWESSKLEHYNFDPTHIAGIRCPAPLSRALGAELTAQIHPSTFAIWNVLLPAVQRLVLDGPLSRRDPNSLLSFRPYPDNRLRFTIRACSRRWNFEMIAKTLSQLQILKT